MKSGILNIILLLLSLIIGSNFIFAQIGPGGVGDNTTNKLWLKADAITGLADGESVTTWNDASGNSNNFTQSTAKRKPTYITSIINGNPVVYFYAENGNKEDYMTSSFTVPTQNLTMFTVLYHNDPDGPVWVTDNGTTNTGFCPYDSDDGNQKLYTGSWLQKTSTFANSTWYSTVIVQGTGYSEIWKDGMLSDNNAQNSGTLGTFEIAKSNNDYFDGYIAEIIHYNYDLNDAERIIVENYIAAKYNLSITNDKYAFQGSYGNDVAGIGRVDASNTHSEAESSGILRIGNSSSLGDGDYLLFGHDNGDISTWTTTEAPNSGTNTQRIAREWKLDETGDVGTVTISIDPTDLGSLPAGYNTYVVWVDGDGDFSTGATQYPLILNSGLYVGNNIDIADANYITVGIIKPVIEFSTSASGNSETNSSPNIEISVNFVLADDITVDYSVSGGTATGGGTDYSLAGATVTITAGNTTTNITPAIINDTEVESGETIIIDLSNPSGATLGATTTHTYTITDDDASRDIDFQSSSSGGGESTTPVSVTVQLSSVDNTNASSVDYTVTGGTATGGGTDFTLAAGTATITAGNTTTSFDITIIDDIYDESDETIIITLSNPSNAVLGTNQVFTYTITDNDSPPEVQYSLTSSNGGEAVSPVNIEISLSAETEEDVTVDYSVSGGTATGSGTDYTLAGGTATITAGTTTTNISATITNDTDVEDDETIIVDLSNPSANATLGDNTSHTFTINDDDNDRKIDFSTSSSNGDESATPVTVTIQINNIDEVNPTTVDYTVTGGTATGGGSDYTVANGTATITAGNTTTSFDITINDDSMDELDETIIFTLSNPTNSNLGTNTVFTYTINDNDDPPTIEFSNSSSNESESTSSKNIEISLSVISGQDVTVDYTVTGGTATGSGTDYTLANGTATVTAGNTTTNINISLTNDTELESGETVIIELSDPSGADLGATTTHTFTINDDDSSREIDFNASSSNGDESVTPVSLTIRINSIDNDNSTTVDYTVTGGTATGSGTDYTLANGTATIVAGNLSTIVNITVVDDFYDENNESIIITLSNPTNSTLGSNQVYTYTINDNDDLPTIEYSTSSSSGSENSSPANVEISLSAEAEEDVTVDYTVTGGTATGGGTDYTLSNGTATVTSSNTTTSISITIVDDASLESNETIIIELSNPSSNATLGTTTSHTFTINDDDNDGYEGPGGIGNNSTNKLWLKADAITGLNSGDPVTTWSDASGNSNNASQSTANRKPTYYTNQVNGLPALYFDDQNGNREDYLSTSFTLTNQNMTVFTVFSHSSGTGPLWVSEKNTTNSGFYPYDGTNQKLWTGASWLQKASTFSSGTYYSSIIIHKSGASEIWKDGTLNDNNSSNSVGLGTYEIGNGNYNYYKGYIAEIIFYNKSLNDAQRIIVENYLAAKYGLTISNDNYAYQAAHSYDVAGIGRVDASNMHTEAMSAEMFKVSNAGDLGNGEYLLFGHDNGSITSWTTTEAPSGTQRIAREWRLDETGDVGTVDLALDITDLPSKPAGYNTYIVFVDSDGDFSAGATSYDLSLDGGFYIAAGTAISDGDYISFGVKQPTVEFTASISEGSEGTTPAMVEISISADSDQDISVDYTVTGGTASGSGTDYTLADGTATITAGNTTTNISITINNDVIDENDETIVITLSNPTNSSLGTNTEHTFTITDNDPAPPIQFTATTSSGSEPLTPLNIEISLSAQSGLDATVDYTVTGGTATGSGTDYTLADGTATITAGNTTTNITLSITDDELCEGDETIVIALSNPSNSSLGSNTTHTYTIEDDEICASEWTGSVSSDWDNAGNWTHGVPNPTIDVTFSAIAPNDPVIAGNAECEDITISSGSKLSVDPTGTLTVYGALIANDTLYFESDISNTASLIDNGTISGSGPFIVERYLTNHCWHYFSPPISDATGGMLTGVWSNKYYYDETGQQWVQIDNEDPLTVMKGADVYVATSSDKTSKFDGTLNTGSKSINTTAGGQGWNLIGNPYPSAIDWDASSGWTKTNINDAIYFMKSDGNFATYIMGVGTNGGTQYIPAMQGFWVKATGAGTVGVTNDVRVNNSQAFWKNSKVTYPLLGLTIEGEAGTDETITRFVEGSTMNFDGAYDAYKKFSTNPEIPQLYTVTPDESELSINTMPEITAELEVPLNVRIGTNDTYSISITQIENFSDTMPIYLEDLKIDSVLNLKSEITYSFIGETTDTARFILLFYEPDAEANWTGATPDWNTASNWSNNSIPGNKTNVTIKADATNQPVIDDNCYCKNITIEPGASLIINTGNILDAGGDLVLLSDASGTGQIIDNGTLAVSGTTTMQSYIYKQAWHYVSPPISNANSSMFSQAGQNFYSYNETSESWQSVSGSLTVMKGYNTYMYYDHDTVLYSGTLNTGSQSIEVTNGSQGWNLVGNPYPSAIDWDAASGWTKTNINDAIYIWDNAVSNYAAYVDGVGTNGGTQYIAPGQGFWIKATGTGTLGTTNDVRVISDQAFREDRDVSNTLKLTVNSSLYYDETIIRFKDNATDDFDDLYDALKKFSYEYVPMIYSKASGDQDLAVNSSPFPDSYCSIPLYFKVNTNGNYTITADLMESFDQSVTIYLEDVLTGNWTILNQDPSYTFSHSTGNALNRFILHFYGITTDTDEINDNSLYIYSYSDNLYIRSSTELLNGTVEVYDVVGRMIFSQNINNTTIYRHTLDNPSGNYIVKLRTGAGIYTRILYFE